MHLRVSVVTFKETLHALRAGLLHSVLPSPRSSQHQPGPSVPGPRSPLSHKQGGGGPTDTTRATGKGVGSDPVPAPPHAWTGEAFTHPPDVRSLPSWSLSWHTSPRGCWFRCLLSHAPPPPPRCRTPGSNPPSSTASRELWTLNSHLLTA